MTDDPFLDNLQVTPPPTAKKGGKKAAFTSATDFLPDDAVELLKKDTTTVDEHHKRHTIIVRKEWIPRIEEIAAELGTNKTDAWKTIFILGFRAFESGQRPKLQTRKRALNVLAEEE